jgi:hypothetical protein
VIDNDEPCAPAPQKREDLFTIRGPQRVHLSEVAREYAYQWWPELTPEQAERRMAQHLLEQDRLRQKGQTQGE